MREQTATFIRMFFDKHPQFNPKNVLDVGSLDEDETMRKALSRGNYIGVDMRKGPGVDRVVNGHDLVKEFGEDSFDMVMCFDTLEHDDAFWKTVEQMKKVLKPQGYLLIGVPSNHTPLHRHPMDYWRFMDDSFQVLFDNMNDFYMEIQKDNPAYEGNDEIYGWGQV